MPTTNITSISGVIGVTVGTAQPRYYFGGKGNYFFSPDGTYLTLYIGSSPQYQQYDNIPFTDLRINGQTPASVAEAKVLLNAVFPNTNSGSSGSGLPSQTGHAGQYLTTNGTAASWAAISAATTIYTGDGQLAGDRTVDLNGKVLHFQQGGNDFLNLDPTPDAERATLQAINTTDDGNSARVDFFTADDVAGFSIVASFNADVKLVEIAAWADATTSTLTYTADTHAFSAAQQITMTVGGVQTFSVEKKFFFGTASDGTGNAQIIAVSDAGDQNFDLSTSDGTHVVELIGNSVAQTIALTAANGVTINGNPALSGTSIAANQIPIGVSSSSLTSNTNFVWSVGSIGANVNSVGISGVSGGGIELRQANDPKGLLFNFAADVHFRAVTGDLYIQGTANKTSIGNSGSAPNSTLQVVGSFATAYVAKTSTYTITALDYTINCTSGTFTATLPTAVGIAGRFYFITNSGAGTITLATDSSQTFANVVATPTTLTIATLTGVVVVSNGANWLKVSSF